MMPGMFGMLWMPLVMLLFLVVVVAIIWLLVGWLSNTQASTMQRTTQAVPTPTEQEESTYEQGYRPPEPRPETYQEGGKQYQYPQPQYEQPQVQYPQEQEMPGQH